MLEEYVLQISVNLGFPKKVVLKILLRLLLLGHVKGEIYDLCSEGSLKESFQKGMLCPVLVHFLIRQNAVLIQTTQNGYCFT